MAAKTFWAWWTDCEFTTEERAACEAAWNAATEAVEEKFTSTNSAMVPCPRCLPDKQCDLGFSGACGIEPCRLAQHQ